jgi:hypothetical protein
MASSFRGRQAAYAVSQQETTVKRKAFFLQEAKTFMHLPMFKSFLVLFFKNEPLHFASAA